MFSDAHITMIAMSKKLFSGIKRYKSTVIQTPAFLCIQEIEIKI